MLVFISHLSIRPLCPTSESPIFLWVDGQFSSSLQTHIICGPLGRTEDSEGLHKKDAPKKAVEHPQSQMSPTFNIHVRWWAWWPGLLSVFFLERPDWNLTDQVCPNAYPLQTKHVQNQQNWARSQHKMSMRNVFLFWMELTGAKTLGFPFCEWNLHHRFYQWTGRKKTEDTCVDFEQTCLQCLVHLIWLMTRSIHNVCAVFPV